MSSALPDQDVEKFVRILNDPLPLPLPVLGPIQDFLLTPKEARSGHSKLARCFLKALSVEIPATGAAENAYIPMTNASLEQVVVHLLAETGLPLAQTKRNQRADSTISGALRPDFQLYIGSTLYILGEERSEELTDAEHDLQNKFSPWAELRLQSSSYFICWAQGGPFFELLAVVHRNQQRLIHSRVLFDLRDLNHRYRLCVAVVNVVRLLRSMQRDANEAPLPFVPDSTEKRVNGTSITYSSPLSVTQTVPIHLADMFKVNYAALRDIYGAVQCTRFIESRDYVKFQLSPVGLPGQTPNTEGELVSAVSTVLHFLVGLHDKGYAHGDLRWPNVLSELLHTDRWFVIDVDRMGPFGSPAIHVKDTR